MKERSVGYRLGNVRTLFQLSQEKFAKELNITQQSYSLIEKNKRAANINVVKLVGKKFNVNLNWLLLGEGPIFRPFGENIGEYEEMARKLAFYLRKIEELFLDKKYAVESMEKSLTEKNQPQDSE